MSKLYLRWKHYLHIVDLLPLMVYWRYITHTSQYLTEGKHRSFTSLACKESASASRRPSMCPMIFLAAPNAWLGQHLLLITP